MGRNGSRILGLSGSFQQRELKHVTVPIRALEHLAIEGAPGEKVEATRLERLDEPQLGEVVDEAVVDSADVVLDRIIERGHDYPFISEVVLRVLPVEPADDSTQMRSTDEEGVKSCNLVADVNENVEVLVGIEDLCTEEVLLEEPLAWVVDPSVFDRTGDTLTQRRNLLARNRARSNASRDDVLSATQVFPETSMLTEILGDIRVLANVEVRF